MSHPVTTRSRSIVVEYELAHPPAKVWRALTESALLARWLMQNDIQPVVGHRFTLRATPVPGWDGIVECEVLDAEAPRHLVYTWSGGSADQHGDGGKLDTIVSWALVPSATGTKVRLQHAGFQPKDTSTYDSMNKGWIRLGERLAEVLATIDG